MSKPTDCRGFRRTARIAKGLSVEITIAADGRNIVCEWIPTLPHNLTGKQKRAYQQARDRVIAEWTKATQSGAIVIEV